VHDFESAHVRHHDVKQDEVGALFLFQTQGFQTTFGRDDAKPL
jgi:hypothetical protein